MGKLTVNGFIVNSHVTSYRKVHPIHIPFNHYKSHELLPPGTALQAFFIRVKYPPHGSTPFLAPVSGSLRQSQALVSLAQAHRVTTTREKRDMAW